MKWNDHSRLEGTHAFLSPSKYHWLNYDNDHLRQSYLNAQAAALGTRIHALAAEHIRLGIKMGKQKKTLNMHVNDAIGFGMDPEVILFHSFNCYGSADAICFRNGKLRIHDLKTGITPAKMDQLYIYNALFCLEYGIKPFDIESELRIYQNDEVAIAIPDPNDIAAIMEKIIESDSIIAEMKEQEV